MNCKYIMCLKILNSCSKQSREENHVETWNIPLKANNQIKTWHTCMQGGNEGSLWLQGAWSGWLPQGGCWSKEFHDGGPGSVPPGPLQEPPSLGGPPLQFPGSLCSFHIPSWLFHGGQGGGGCLGSKGGWKRSKNMKKASDVEHDRVAP